MQSLDAGLLEEVQFALYSSLPREVKGQGKMMQSDQLSRRNQVLCYLR